MCTLCQALPAQQGAGTKDADIRYRWSSGEGEGSSGWPGKALWSQVYSTLSANSKISAIYAPNTGSGMSTHKGLMQVGLNQAFQNQREHIQQDLWSLGAALAYKLLTPEDLWNFFLGTCQLYRVCKL